jgi:hypothetical protein
MISAFLILAVGMIGALLFLVLRERRRVQR